MKFSSGKREQKCPRSRFQLQLAQKRRPAPAGQIADVAADHAAGVLRQPQLRRDAGEACPADGLLSNHISHPESLILRTDEDPTEALEKAGFFNCWIKRGDFHATPIERQYAAKSMPSFPFCQIMTGFL